MSHIFFTFGAIFLTLAGIFTDAPKMITNPIAFEMGAIWLACAAILRKLEK